MKKLVIKFDNCYITEDNAKYLITKNPKKAKNFMWMLLWATRSDILSGINNLYGAGQTSWQFAWI